MKNLTLTLIILLGVSFGSFAAETHKKPKKARIEYNNRPPHNNFYVGSYHRNIHPRAEMIIVNRQTFYVHQGIYFQAYRRGFVVVQPPRMVRPQYQPSHRPPTSYRHNNYRQPAPRQCTPAPQPQTQAPQPHRGCRR